MPTQREKAERFHSLHAGEAPLLLPNPWDVGSAMVLVSLGFSAIATTSSGHAATLGRLDGGVTRDEALAHAAAIAAATDVPVSADLERCFADDPEGVAETVRLALAAGLAGCSVEDAPGHGGPGIAVYDAGLARARVEAAAEVAHATDVPFVLTARAENLLHGSDLADTIARLQSFQEAGADVLFAPGVIDADDIASIVRSVDRPVNVLVLPGVPTVPELAALGVARVSVGGGFAYAAIGALVEAGRELLDQGTFGYFARAGVGRSAVRSTFTP